MLTSSEAQAQIEALVVRRKSHSVAKAVPRFLKRFAGERPELVFVACDWFRRLGAHDHALRLLKIERFGVRRSTSGPSDRLRRLWAARLFNLMGAPELAKELLGEFEPESVEELRILGSIELTQGEEARAERYLRRAVELDRDPRSYGARLSRVNWADACAGVKDYDRAISIAREVFAGSSESLLRGIALQAEGEYLARSDRFELALVVLERALSFFPQGDSSPDFGFLIKWLAYVHARLGHRREARAGFDQAYRLLRATSARPEAWLDVLRLRHQVGHLGEPEMRVVCEYPGLSPGFRSTLPVLPPEVEAKPKSRSLWIDLSRDEYSIGGEAILGVPLEIRALAYVRLSGEWGIPSIKLKSLLWQGQAYAFLQLENRLQQILHRLRNTVGIKIRSDGSCISLDRRELRRIDVIGAQVPARMPRLLAAAHELNRSKVQAYYGLSPARACLKLNEWERRGWISRVDFGPKTAYRVTGAGADDSDRSGRRR